MKEIVDNLDFIQIKILCSMKDIVREWEDKPQTGRSLQKTHLVITLLFKQYEDLFKTQQCENKQPD